MPSPRLLILPILLVLGACTGDTLTFNAWTAENLPDSAVDRNFDAAAAITCTRGAQKQAAETEHTGGGELHHYTYNCVSPDGAPASTFWDTIF